MTMNRRMIAGQLRIPGSGILISITFLFLVLGLIGKATAETTQHQIQRFKITILSTMLVGDTTGIGEWGFAALVDVDSHRMLVDTGAHPDTVIRNAHDLHVDLLDVQEVILTHYHWDHVGGLLTLRREVVDISHHAGLAPKSRLDHSLEPQIEHIMQIYVTQQYADRPSLRSSFFARMNLSILQNTCLQPAPNQTNQTLISYSVLHEAEHPFVTQAPEEILEVRLQHPLDFPASNLSRKTLSFSASCRFSPAHCSRLLTTIFEVGDKIDGHPEVLRADVELLAHDSNQAIPTYSKEEGHHDPNHHYTSRQQAGR
jgi:hypothetical protein